MRRVFVAVMMIGLTLVIVGSVIAQKPPPGTPPPRPGEGGGNPPPNDAGSTIEMDASVLQVTLDFADYETFGNALADQITAGDGRGVDNFGSTRNSVKKATPELRL